MRDEVENSSWNYDYIRLAWDSGFCFSNQKAENYVNLNSLSLVDVEKTITERDIASVEKHISTIINYNLDDEHTRILDGTFVKVFKLSQLAIQYLLFCKKYLDHTVTLLKKEIQELNQENRNLLEEADIQKQDIFELKRRLKDYHQVIPEKTYQCNQCSKMFSSEDFLLSHVKRRHENPPLIQTEADKLQLEIKELKERLNSTEKYIQQDQPIAVQSKELRNEEKEKSSQYTEIHSEVDKLRIQLENQVKLMEEQKSHQEKYEKWMEMAFQKFENKQMEIIDKKLCHQTKTIGIQTTECRTIETQYEEMPASSLQSINSKVEELEQIKADFVKIQKEIEQEATNRFAKIEGFLEEKVSDKFEKFSKQIETFWNKIEETQIKTKQNSNIIVANSEKDARNLIKPSSPVIQIQQSSQSSEDEVTGTESPFRPRPQLQPKPQHQPRFQSQSQFQTQVQPQPQPRASKINTTSKGVNMYQEIYEKPIKDVDNSSLDKYVISSDGDSDSSKFVKKTTAKPSRTSTLGKHSITSLKRVALDDGVKIGLSKELEGILSSRLVSMGISPEWNGLPKESFNKALTLVKHQASLTRKKLPKYDKIKKTILKKIDKQFAASSIASGGDGFKKAVVEKHSSPSKLKPQPYINDSSESTSPIKVIYTKAVKKTIVHEGAGESNVSSQLQTKPIPAITVDDAIKESGDGEKESSKTNVKKKVLFDLESLSRNSSDAEKLEAIVKQNENQKNFHKPIYIDELKGVISMKSKDNDSTIESITFDEKIEKAPQDIQSKDPDASDWDISEILN